MPSWRSSIFPMTRRPDDPMTRLGNIYARLNFREKSLKSCGKPLLSRICLPYGNCSGNCAAWIGHNSTAEDLYGQDLDKSYSRIARTGVAGAGGRRLLSLKQLFCRVSAGE